MRSASAWAALLAALALSACSGAVNPLAAGAQVTCGSDADCPGGSFCSQVLGRCVQRGGSDQTPPSLVGTPTVNPPTARGGTPVTVTFEVSEDLSTTPDVRFANATEPLGLPSRSGRFYTVEFAATALSGGGPHNIVATLVDLFGNEARNVLVGQLTLDLTLPQVVTSSFPAFARSGSPFSGTITFDEPLGGTPSLTVVGGPALSAAAGPGANQWTFSRTLDGSEPSGPVDLFLATQDVAGNVLELTFSAASTFDFTAPTVANAAIGTPSVREGDTFFASLQFSEALGASPTVTLVPGGGGAALPVTVSALDPATYTLSYDVPLGAADASYTLTLASAADRSGNPAAVQALGTVAFDSTAPSITGLTPDHANRLYRAAQPVQVTFTLGEAPAAAPTVRLEVLPSPLALACTSVGLAYTCTSDPIPAGLPDGGVNVSVTAADGAGNVGSGSTSLTLDFTPPALASAPATRYLGSAATRGVAVSAVGTASSWEISLITSEPLSAAPSVVAVAPGGGQTRTLTLTGSNAPTNTSFTFTLPASATAFAAATWSVQWTATDRAGNTHATPQAIATVDVDGVPPAAPAPGTAASPQVVWTRTPWGTDTSTTPVFQLTATPTAVGADATVLIAWDGSGAAAREVGRDAVDGTGFSAALSSDPAELYVSTLDAAGNESPRTRVVDVVWTASLAGKVPGSSFENPHRLETRTRSLGALAQADGVQVAGGALGVRGDGQVVTTAAAALYRPAARVANPGPRILYNMGADPSRGVVMLYGGRPPDLSMPGDVWEWDGVTWRQVFPTDPEGDGNPSATLFGSFVYDPIRGGLLAHSPQGLWLWNGTSWRNLGAVPVAGGALAWDARRAILVLLGNDGGTYEWSGGTWRNAAPAVSPSPVRQFEALFYDTVVSQVCMYGGRTQAGVYQDDLWCYDGTRWTQVAMAGTPPFARSDYAYAWDEARGELFIQSGRPSASVTVDGKTWILKRVGGTPTWSDATPASGPLNLRQHAATYDPGSGRVLMYGDLTVTEARLRAWNGTAHTYTALSPGDPEGDGNPSFLFRTSSPVYVPSRDRVVFPLMDSGLHTWEWDGASWALKAIGGGGPITNTSEYSSGWYGTSLVTFGGNSLNVAQGDTWGWNGTAWSLLQAATPRPPSANDEHFRANAGMATDPASGRLFRMGGYDSWWNGASAVTHCYVDVWEWNVAGFPNAWTKLQGEPWADPEGDGSPTPGAFLVYSPCNARERLIWSPTLTLLLYDDTGNGIWEWRQATASWRRHPMTGATPGIFQAFFWDTTLAAPVLIDFTRAYVANLTTNVWTPLPYANPFSATPPTVGTFAFDTNAGVAVGVEASPIVWESPFRATPAHVLTIDYSRAGGPDPAVCVTGAACPIQRIDLTWSAGGTAAAGNGATLQAWTAGWQTVATNGSAAASPSVMTYAWTPASASPAATLFHGGARELAFAIVPNGSSTATTSAQVGSDAVSVTIRYRRP